MRKYTAIKYAIFALIATTCNLGSQRLVEYLYWLFGIKLTILNSDMGIYIALIVGTGVGLAVKYFLDKLLIFYYKTKSVKEDVAKFILYTLMGIITTAIFWATELVFNALFPYIWAKYIGGAIGLAVGYTVKYLLDKRFVFRYSPDL